MGVFTRGFHHNALFLLQKQKMRARKLLANKKKQKDRVPRGFLLCARTHLKLTKNQGFSTFLDAEKEFLHAVCTTMRYFYCKNRK